MSYSPETKARNRSPSGRWMNSITTPISIPSGRPGRGPMALLNGDWILGSHQPATDTNGASQAVDAVAVLDVFRRDRKQWRGSPGARRGRRPPQTPQAQRADRCGGKAVPRVGTHSYR